MSLGLATADWAQLLIAVFTACAAGAALASVMQAQRIWRAGVEPSLVGTWTESTGTDGTDSVYLDFQNVGGGFVQQAAFAVVCEQTHEAAYGFIPPTGLLRGGDRSMIKT